MKRGLVLDGGGLRGAYQVGAYKALKELNIKFDAIVGTSIGSVNAAFLACNKYDELHKLWTQKNVGKIIGIEEKLVEEIEKHKVNYNIIKGIAKIVKDGGLETKYLKKTLDENVNQEELLNSNIDYGLITYKLNELEPIKIFKKDIPQGKLTDYILASCFLPVFKKCQLIDEKNTYVDGGFYNNSPVELLLDQNFDEIYVIKLQAIGMYKRIKPTRTKIINIEPSKNLGSILDIQTKNVKKNINMGYYDALKTLGKLDGYQYNFKKRGMFYYNFLVRKFSQRELRRIKNYFNSKDNKELILKSIEYILKREGIELDKIQSAYQVKKKLKNIYKNHFIYDFVKKIKIL